jgi:hypothetical protein
MSDDESPHWSCAVWSTHIFGVHVSAILPLTCVLFAGMSIWILVLWITISVVTHYSGRGLVGYVKRLKVKLGRLIHGESRIRKNRHIKIKRMRGTL